MNPRLLAVSSLALLLLSCAGSSPSTSATPALAPEAPPGLASEPPAAVVSPAQVMPEEGASCADGRDNDGDGLLDCEEASCALSSGCTEICGNGEDDDDNGLTDDLDAPCWTPHSTTPRITAQVGGGGDIHHKWNHVDEHYSRGWVGNMKSSSTRDLTLASAWGTAQVTTSASGVFNCTWGASGIAFGWDFYHRYAWHSSSYTSTLASSAIPVTRSLSWVDSGCPVGASSFLPAELKTSATGQFAASASGSIVGRRWYMAAFPYFGGDFSSERSQDGWGRFRRTEVRSTMTGELRAGDSVVFAP